MSTVVDDELDGDENDLYEMKTMSTLVDRRCTTVS